MPRFNDRERELIRRNLLKEAERLFIAFGLKKVSIDELAQAAGIAKGSFYSFYSSKERLFFDIATEIQEKIWNGLESFLESHKDLAPRALLKETFIWMLGRIEEYPFLQKMDGETTEHLFRKLPEDVTEAHTRDDGAELIKLQEYGIRFSLEISVAAKIFQSLALIYFSMSKEERAIRDTVIKTVLEGTVNEIVSE